MVVADDLGAVEEDVPFDWDGADRLARQFDATAATISDQQGTRSSAGTHALIDWEGPYSKEFVSRQDTGDQDAGEISSALQEAAEQVRAMKRAAQEEQDRRVKAREYIRAMEENEKNESTLNKIGDFLGGEDFEKPPKPPPPKPEPSLSPPPGTAGSRG